FVLGDGILKLALLDILLRIGEDLLLIEPEQCHKSFRTPDPGVLVTTNSEPKLRHYPLNTGGCSRVSRGHLLHRQMADRTRPIVRPDVMEGMVTKGYRKGVYRRVTEGIMSQTGPFTGVIPNLSPTSSAIS